MQDYILLITPLAAWMVAQSTKFLLKMLKGDFNMKYALASGNMPSAHTALVGGLAVAVLLQEGMRSASFAISAVLLIVVTYDALNVRRAVGQHRKAILRLYANFPDIEEAEEVDDPLRRFESLGHTPLEVFVGGCIAAVVGLIVHNMLIV